MVSGSKQRMMREMVEESLSGTWAGMAQGDLAPEMMSSTKLSTVSRERGEDVPLAMTQASPGLWRAGPCYHTGCLLPRGTKANA